MDILLAVDHPHHGLAAHFGELVGRDAALEKSVHDFGDGAFHDGRIRTGFAAPAAPSEAQVADTETGGVDGVHELTLLAEFAPKQGAVTGAEHAEEEICRQTAFVEITRDAPAGDALHGADIAHEVGPADTALRGLELVRGFDERAAGEATEPAFGGREGFFGRHAAAEREHDIGWHVTSGMVGAEIVGGDADEELTVADHGLAERMRADGLLEHRLREHLVVLVVAHGDLAQDDFALHARIGVGDQRIEDHVGDGFHRGLETFLRGVDVIHRPVEGRVGVGRAAAAVDGVGQFTVRETSRALEDHVLQVVRDPGTFPAAFMDAARAHPGLDGAEADTGAVGVDDLESVGEHPTFGHGAGDLGETQAFKGGHGVDVCPSLAGAQVRP